MNHKFKIGSIIEINHLLYLIITFKFIRTSKFYKNKFVGDCIVFNLFKSTYHLLENLSIYDDEIII